MNQVKKAFMKIFNIKLYNTKYGITKKSIPGPNSLPIIGSKLDLLTSGGGTRLHEYVDRRHKKYGKIYLEKFGATDLIFTSDAAYIKNVFLNLEGKYPMHILPEPWLLYEKLYGNKRGLFFMNGEEWLENRRILNKILLRENSENWIQNPIQKTISSLIREWKENGQKELIIEDVAAEFYKLSINVVIQILLGNNILPASVHHDELLSMFSISVKKIFETTTKLYGFPVHWCQRLNLKIWTDFKECVDLSLFLVNKLVSEMLTQKHKSDGLIKKLVDHNMDNVMISRIVADLIMAAGDTSAYTSMWIFYLLSKNPKQISEIRKKDNIYISYVIKESMRLYPVAPFLTRIIPQDCQLGGYEIKAKTPIIASIYTSGRDEQYFSKAQKFIPYRWDRNDERRAMLINHEPSATLPFALGARSCIGRKIAMLQLTELIRQVVDNFDFECLHTENIKPLTSQVLIPNKTFSLKLCRM